MTDNEMDEDHLLRVVMALMAVHVLKKMHGPTWRTSLESIMTPLQPNHDFLDALDELDDKMNEAGPL